MQFFSLCFFFIVHVLACIVQVCSCIFSLFHWFRLFVFSKNSLYKKQRVRNIIWIRCLAIFSIFPMISLDLIAALSIPSKKKFYSSEWNANFDRVSVVYTFSLRFEWFISPVAAHAQDSSLLVLSCQCGCRYRLPHLAHRPGVL